MATSTSTGDTNHHPREMSCPWTDRQIQLFSDLPLPIVRLVLEKAMECRPPPLHLLHVSKQVRSWLEPLVYEHVAIYSDTVLEKFYSTFLECRHSSTKDLAFYRRHVRTFFMCAGYYHVEQLTAILQDLTGIRSLACWDADWGKTAMEIVLDSAKVYEGEDVFPYKQLRRISFSASLLIRRGIAFTHRAFRDITHMDIYFDPAANWESLRFLQYLTHLSLDMVTDLPTPNSDELPNRFSRILDTCPSTVRTVIFGVIDDFNTDFDLMDSEGEYFPPGWPPFNCGPSGLEIGGWAPWLTSEWKCHDNVDLDVLHPIAQLAFGKVDSRAVPGSVTDEVPPSQLFRDLLVYFVWPGNSLDWDGSAYWHRDCWTVAEDIIERRKGLTYAKLVSQISS